MPTRTESERALIASMSVKASDDYCNARTPTGYCGKISGWGTAHVNSGRCKLHGGSSSGRPLVTGAYSQSISKMKDEIDRLSKDSNFLNLIEELSVMKGMFSNLLESINKDLEDDVDVWTTQNRFGEATVHPKVVAMMKMIDTTGKTFERIVAAEAKMSDTLTLRGIYFILQQLKTNVNTFCGQCPVRKSLVSGISQLKVTNE